jgi:hypothetical protein
MCVAVVGLAFVVVPTPAMARPDFTGTALGTLTLGMPAQQAADLGWITAGPSPCNSGWRTARFKKGLFVGVWNNQVMLIATQSRRFRTARGIRPGNSLKRLKTKYSVRHSGRNLYSNDPIFAARGTNLHFTVSKGKIILIELANGFRPDGSEFEC